jgi:cardiolipin synthase A/B
VVDHRTAFVGGINVIDDRHDLHHGWTDQPRLDFAVQVEGPLVLPIAQTTRAMWTRAALGREWGAEVVALARSAEPVTRARRLLQRLRITRRVAAPSAGPQPPMRAALVVRDNLLQRRAIERVYVQAIREARERVDLACPYFYPGRVFRRVLRQAARRGVKVRLLLQGKVDYRIAALAAQALYDELLGHGVEVYEYTPAFLHAKVAVVDGHWATVGSSNIDPISLLLNLEANVVVEDRGFADELRAALEHAMAQSRRVPAADRARTPWALLRRGLVAWCASTYLRMAGITGRY